MKLEISVEDLKEIIVNSNIIDTIIPKSLMASKRNELIDAYSSIILSLLNTRLSDDSRDYRVLNSLINKDYDVVINSDLELFIVMISKVVRDVLVMMNININIEQLITDLTTVINNVAREAVLGIYAVMDIPTFNTFRKHIFTLTKMELSKNDMDMYKKYLKTGIDWMLANPKQFRLAINTITSNVNRKELASREDDIRVSKVKEILTNMISTDYETDVLNKITQLLIYRNYWMVIPDDIMVLKIRRRLGRYTDRLLSILDDNSEFKIKR